MKILFRGLAAGMILFGAAACSSDASRDTVDFSQRAEEIRAMTPRESLTAVQSKLNGGLVVDPEVRAKMEEYTRAYQSGAISRNAAGKELLIWIEQWEHRNPERARAARSEAAARAADVGTRR